MSQGKTVNRNDWDVKNGGGKAAEEGWGSGILRLYRNLHYFSRYLMKFL
ncbi:hypothetical protein ABU162_21980 [Paenibacillus thiaminolyticus]